MNGRSAEGQTAGEELRFELKYSGFRITSLNYSPSCSIFHTNMGITPESPQCSEPDCEPSSPKRPLVGSGSPHREIDLPWDFPGHWFL